MHDLKLLSALRINPVSKYSEPLCNKCWQDVLSAFDANTVRVSGLILVPGFAALVSDAWAHAMGKAMRTHFTEPQPPHVYSAASEAIAARAEAIYRIDSKTICWLEMGSFIIFAIKT